MVFILYLYIYTDIYLIIYIRASRVPPIRAAISQTVVFSTFLTSDLHFIMIKWAGHFWAPPKHRAKPLLFMTPLKPCYGTLIRFRRQYSSRVTPTFFGFISRMQSKSTFFIKFYPRSITNPKNLKNWPHKTMLWAAKTQTRPLRLQRQLWFWRIHQSHHCFRAFARTLLQATLADLLVFIGRIELGRQKINEGFFNFVVSAQTRPRSAHLACTWPL